MIPGDLRAVVAPPCQEYGVERLDLFGSRARGDAGQESDYDFIVSFDDLDVADASRRYFGLLNALKHCLEQKVDLLTYDALSKPLLKQKIMEERVTIYER